MKKVTRWLRQGSRRDAERSRFEHALERLAQRDVSDTIAEEDLEVWMASLDAGARGEREGAARGPDRRR